VTPRAAIPALLDLNFRHQSALDQIIAAVTIVLGIVGSFVGGFLQNLIQYHNVSIHSFHLVGILGSIIGAIVLLILLDTIFTLGSMLVVAVHGGGHMAVMFWFFAASSANAMLLMILVMVLTVYLNNIVAAVIVVVFSYVQGNVSILHAMVQNHVITDRFLSGIVNTAYWLFPHQLLSNLDRDTAITSFHVTCAAGCPELHNQAQALAQELARLPFASSAGDIVYWFAYLMVLCTILYVAIRRKQV